MRCKCLTSVVCIQGDHNGDEVDPRLLFRIDYCLPDCGRKCSQEKQDERQQFNKVGQFKNMNFLWCDFWEVWDYVMINFLLSSLPALTLWWEIRFEKLEMVLLFLSQGEREETEKNGEALKSEPRIDDEQENPEGPLLLTTSF